jgi:hypothetical protein
MISESNGPGILRQLYELQHENSLRDFNWICTQVQGCYFVFTCGCLRMKGT